MIFQEERYVFDTNVFSQLFRFYYSTRFPSLWTKFHEIVNDGRISSVREVMLELGDGRKSFGALEWAKAHSYLFPEPDAQEAQFVRDILAVQHFQRVIQNKKNRVGKRNADTFIIARADSIRGIVVTEESDPPHGARIPNICRRFDVPCINLEKFMLRENWEF